MFTYPFNDQAELAEQFILSNTLTNQASYETVLQIKRWKLSKRMMARGRRPGPDVSGQEPPVLPAGLTCFTLLRLLGFYECENRN